VRARARLQKIFGCACVRVRMIQNFRVRVRARARTCAIVRIFFMFFRK
jgi:hypothetical protein